MGQRPDAAGERRLASDGGRKKKLIEVFREAIRSRHYSRRTEQMYWYWIRYFIFFHGKHHPREMGAAEVTAFLTWLATERNVAAATQNQALSALLFLYKHVLGQELPWLDEMVRAQRPARLPTVLGEPRCAGCLRSSTPFRRSWSACSTAQGCARGVKSPLDRLEQPRAEYLVA